MSAREGNIALLFGVFVFVMLLAGGMAVDFQRANLIRADLQESADAGLLAAVRQKMSEPNMSSGEMIKRARDFFEANRKMKGGVTISKFDIVFDPVNEVYQLSFDTKIKTVLLGAVGTKFLEPVVTTQAKLGRPPYLEIVMALDNTGSMSKQGKLSDLKNSANLLVDTLFNYPDADVRFGLVPFAQYVNVGSSLIGSSWLSSTTGFLGCIGSRAYPANIQDSNYVADKIPGLLLSDCPSTILPLTDDKTKIKTAIGNMNANGWTYIPSGLAWGWRALSADEPFTEGATYADLKNKGGFKALILMTDGENTRSPDYPTHDGTDVALANQLTSELCVAIKKENIIIYTIAFKVNDTTIKYLLQDCGTTKGHYFAAENSKDLAAAFEAIASSLRSISISG